MAYKQYMTYTLASQDTISVPHHTLVPRQSWAHCSVLLATDTAGAGLLLNFHQHLQGQRQEERVELLKTLAATHKDKNIQLKIITSVAKRGKGAKNPEYQAISPGFHLKTPSLVIVG